MEVELRLVLLMSEHSRDQPALPWPQFQIAGQTFTPKAAVAPTRTGLSLGKAPPFGRSDAPIVTIKMNLTSQRGFSRTGEIQPIMLYQARQVV
jgi:hypothetical protein